MASKHFNISDSGVDILKEVQEEQGFKTEIATLEYILRMHNKEDGVYGPILNKIRIACQAADKNIQSLKEVANTVLVKQHPDTAHLFTIGSETGDMTHPLIEKADNHVKNKIAKAKQIKDNNGRKK